MLIECCCFCCYNKSEVIDEDIRRNQFELTNFNNVIIPQYNIPTAIETHNKNIQTDKLQNIQ